MNARIRVDLLDRLIQRIHKQHKRQELVQKLNTLNMRGKEAEAYYNQSKNLRKRIEESLANKNLDSASIANYTIKIFQSHPTSTQLLVCFLLLL